MSVAQYLLAYLALVATATLTGCASVSPPLSGGQIAKMSDQLTTELAVVPEPVHGALTVDDAVARAVRYNHAIRAKELQAAVATAKVLADSGSMLPSFIAESDYYRRDRPLLSRSNQSETYATSTDPSSVARDITLSWNILDFGLSLVRSKQGLDRALQQQEEVRRIRARIIEETRSLFWRTVALEKLGPAEARLQPEVDAAIKLSRAAARNLLVDPMAQVTFQRDLLNLQRDMNQLDLSLAGVTGQLKTSIAYPLDIALKLDGNRAQVRLPALSNTPDQDLRIALSQRPEIRQHMYDMRITEDEVKATLLQLLPGISLINSFTSDSNSFLYNANWVSWGTKIAVNLINLARLPADLNSIEAQMQAHRQNAVATAAAIAMQVHVARARIAVQQRAYRDAETYAKAQRELLQQVEATVAAGKVGQQASAREKLATLLAEARVIVAFADLHAAYAAYATAVGDDLAAEPDAATGFARWDAANYIRPGSCSVVSPPSRQPCLNSANPPPRVANAD